MRRTPVTIRGAGHACAGVATAGNAAGRALQSWLHSVSSNTSLEDVWPVNEHVSSSTVRQGLRRLFGEVTAAESSNDAFAAFCENALLALLTATLTEARQAREAAPEMPRHPAEPPARRTHASSRAPALGRKESLKAALWQLRTQQAGRDGISRAASLASFASIASPRATGGPPARVSDGDPNAFCADLVSLDGSCDEGLDVEPPRQLGTQPYALLATDQADDAQDARRAMVNIANLDVAEEGRAEDGQPAGGDQLPAAAVSLDLSRVTKTTMNATYVEDCEDGTAELNQYVLLDPLGKGSQGEVFLAMDTEKNELRAIKAVRRPIGVATGSAAGRPVNAARQRQREQLEREVAIMKLCRHAHVVRLYEVIDDPEHDKMYLVMQHVQHGPIASVATDGGVSRTIAPDVLVRYARQLVDGLTYLHRRGIIHRDIKPENILLGADEQVYLADFGTAEAFERGATARVIGTRGTLAFVAPELLDSRTDHGHAVPFSASLSLLSDAGRDSSPIPQSTAPTVGGEGVDVWALGVTLYALLYGELPFFADDAPKLFNRILTADASFTPRDSSFDLSASRSPCSLLHVSGHWARRSASTLFHPSEEAEAQVPGDAESPARREWRALLRGMLQKKPAVRWTLADVSAGIDRIEAAYQAEQCEESPTATISALRTATKCVPGCEHDLYN